MRDITVLLTCCGGLVAPPRIRSLKEIKERGIRIIGVDMEGGGAGLKFVDKSYIVPAGGDPNYIEKILEICKKEAVDVLLPCADEELLPLSKNTDKFEKIGTKIAVSNYRSLEIALDKGSLYNFLKGNNIPTPKYFIPKNIEEFERAVYKLGYPEKDVVFKPRKGRGNRGFRIIKENIDKKDLLLNHKPGSVLVQFEEIKEMLGKGDFPPSIVVEYLPGEEYSVDLLAKEGQALIMVPKIRILTIPGPSLIGEVKKNTKGESLVKKICKALKFDYNINMQFKYSASGELFISEVNPRIGGTINACNPAGANLLYYGIKMALEERIPKVKIKEGVRMIRYFEELYLLNNRIIRVD